MASLDIIIWRGAQGPRMLELTGRPARAVADNLLALHRDQRIDGFVFWATEGEPVEQIRRYTEQVVPVVRTRAGT
ncbi:hypothetical protein ACRS6B_05455 [Nocardia asteroides]